MSGHADILGQSVDRLFADIAASETPAVAWQSVETLGVPSLFLAEDAGGMDGTWADASLVFRLCGYHALDLPVGETMIARGALQREGVAVPDGPILIGEGKGRLDEDERYSGTVRVLAPGFEGAPVLVALRGPGQGGCILVDTKQCTSVQSVLSPAGETRDLLTLDNAACTVLGTLDAQSLFEAGALLRSNQIGGALAACLALCTRYAGERSQFGRELRKFQAIQHQIALLAEETAAIVSAGAAAAIARDHGQASFEIACAKLRANQASGCSAMFAHQIHGAIGITREYGLHPHSRRLWSWRSEFGNDRYWAQTLGAMMLSEHTGSPWHRLTTHAGDEYAA